ncbi:MAG: Dabb family protein [Pseudomonadota bacterium]
MHVHTALFWLLKTLSPEDRQAFRNGLDLLTSDPRIRARSVGVPAETHRSVIERGYDYGIVLTFDSLSDHDAYQSGAPHQQFLDTCAHMWTRVQVIDLQT